MGIMVYSLLGVMQEIYHQPYFNARVPLWAAAAAAACLVQVSGSLLRRGGSEDPSRVPRALGFRG